MKTLLLCVAGRSTRFDSGTPKWVLPIPPFNKPMAVEAVNSLQNNFDKMVVAYNGIGNKLNPGNLEPVFEFCNHKNIEYINVGQTESHCETVSLAIRFADIKGSVTIRDSDNSFDLSKSVYGNSVYVCNETPDGFAWRNKSYSDYYSGKSIKNITSRGKISPWYNVGVYSFEQASDFSKYWIGCGKPGDIPSVIKEAMDNQLIFWPTEIKGFNDWGTQKDYDNYVSRLCK